MLLLFERRRPFVRRSVPLTHSAAMREGRLRIQRVQKTPLDIIRNPIVRRTIQETFLPGLIRRLTPSDPFAQRAMIFREALRMITGVQKPEPSRLSGIDDGILLASRERPIFFDSSIVGKRKNLLEGF